MCDYALMLVDAYYAQNCAGIMYASLPMCTYLHMDVHTRMCTHTHARTHTQDRKVIVKSFKPYVKKICMEEYGHVVMMGVFDSVDDTVLVKKNLLSVSCKYLYSFLSSFVNIFTLFINIFILFFFPS